MHKSKSILWWLAGFFKPFRLGVHAVCSYLSKDGMLWSKSISARFTESVSMHIYTFPLALLTWTTSIALVKLLFFCRDKSLLNTDTTWKTLRRNVTNVRTIVMSIFTLFIIRLFIWKILCFPCRLTSCSLLAFSHSPASQGDREWFEVKGE